MDRQVGGYRQGGSGGPSFEDVQWLDRREVAVAMVRPRGGLRRLGRAWRRFVARMQLGPVPGYGAEDRDGVDFDPFSPRLSG